MPRTERSPRAAEALQAQAVHWFTRERLGTLDEAARAQRDAWLAADPEHARLYRAVQATWSVADLLPQDEMRAILERTDDAPRASSRRRLALGLGAACGLALLAGVTGPRLWAPAAQFSASLSTAQGERGRHTLPDGSLLELNTGTRVEVALYSDRREVELTAGEALFTVSPDAARPFFVAAGQARLRVTGTRFNVRREGDGVTLAVEEGSVEFSAGPWWSRRTHRLTAGYVAHYAPGGGLEAPRQENVAAITAWQRGRLEFRDAPLQQVVVELNRYLREPLRIDDAALARLRVAGTLPIDDPEAVLDVLPRIAPVIVLYPAGGGRVLAPR